jgi:hypothetical protein
MLHKLYEALSISDNFMGETAIHIQMIATSPIATHLLFTTVVPTHSMFSELVDNNGCASNFASVTFELPFFNLSILHIHFPWVKHCSHTVLNTLNEYLPPVHLKPKKSDHCMLLFDIYSQWSTHIDTATLTQQLNIEG